MSIYESVSFFSDDIKIKPHTARDEKYIGKTITIREYVGIGMMARLFRNTDTGDYMVEQVTMNAPTQFIEGPETSGDLVSTNGERK
jgi:hypothetical protein